MCISFGYVLILLVLEWPQHWKVGVLLQRLNSWAWLHVTHCWDAFFLIQGISTHHHFLRNPLLYGDFVCKPSSGVFTHALTVPNASNTSLNHALWSLSFCPIQKFVGLSWQDSRKLRVSACEMIRLPHLFSLGYSPRSSHSPLDNLNIEFGLPICADAE